MSRLNELQAEFSEHNLFLQMVLGVIAKTGRVERLLPVPADELDNTVGPVAAVDPFVALLLGVVSLRGQLMDLVEQAGVDTQLTRDGDAASEPGVSSEEPAGQPGPRELMR